MLGMSHLPQDDSVDIETVIPSAMASSARPLTMFLKRIEYSATLPSLLQTVWWSSLEVSIVPDSCWFDLMVGAGT